ncbi:MAG: regulatory protein RecX [Bryobacter sp.]|nr:regulatory protein RecX [Bryobacter sp.]
MAEHEGVSLKVVESPRPRSRSRAAKLDAEALKAYAQRAIGARPMSEKELRTKLVGRAENPADIEPILNLLREYGALGDETFAENFTAARRASRGHGKQRVLADLRRRQVPKELAQATVEAQYAGLDERQLIENYLARKYRGKDLPTLLKEPKHLASAVRRLAGAGFSPGKSYEVLKRYARGLEAWEPPLD